MELQQFEQAILKLAFETDARITTASVAYYLGVPSREANRLLNALLEEGVLELDSDADGNLYYKVPNHPSDRDAMGDLKQLRDGEHVAMLPGTPPPTPEADQPSRPSKVFFNATVDENEDVEPFSPVVSSARGHAEAPDDRPDPGSYGKVWGTSRHKRDNWGGFDDYYEPSGADGDRGSAPRPAPTADDASGTVSRPRPTWTAISTTRSASPDASVDRCGSSPYVVRTETRCEPKPLPSEKPMIVSCSDTPARTRDAGNEQLWFGRPNESTAMVPAGDTALARDYYIEQPEHQPGMALLLSLILCGTGQIYNGEVSKGIMMMVLCFLLWFVLLGWVVHIWSIVDAVVVAERLNRKTG
jgi:hypothetical protein